MKTIFSLYAIKNIFDDQVKSNKLYKYALSRNRTSFLYRYLLFFLILSNHTFADDTDILLQQNRDISPNVLLILDNSSSMDTPLIDLEGNPTDITRMDALRGAIDNLLESVSGVNIGIMRFNNPGASIIKTIDKYSKDGLDPDYSDKNSITEVVKNLDPYGPTPIVDALYEAAIYFRGDEVYHGKQRFNTLYPELIEHAINNKISIADSYIGGSHELPIGCPDSDSNMEACTYEKIKGTPSYISPISNQCQENHILLLSDGAANVNKSQEKIKALIGKNCEAGYSEGETCGRDLLEWLATNDQAKAFPEITNSIKTHSIAFDLEGDAMRFLVQLSRVGNGHFYSADNAASLSAAFKDIFQKIFSNESTFVTPAITVNQFNRLNHRSTVYFSLFKSKPTAAWTGNLKGYYLTGDPAILSDVNGNPALDPSTGYFNESAQSLWSPSVDGNEVESGGAASQLDDDPNKRKIYTYIGNNPMGNKKSLFNTSNKFHESNANITMEHIGAKTEEERKLILQWARGFDLKDNDEDGVIMESRRQFGDILHSSPQVVTYGGTDEKQDGVIFFGTNEGFLHAIDEITGKEVFSFIPKETMKNLNRLYHNSENNERVYGMDGVPTVWIKDENGDGIIEKEKGDHVYLYIGMRRGGKNLYALDISDRNSPSILWIIEGGNGDFKDLGQTWSKPIKTRIKIASEAPRDVLVFGGGFDVNQDSVQIRTPDKQGAAIYIVDAKTGERLWAASSNMGGDSGLTLVDMKYSIPADIAVIDINLDGLADQFYVGDMGGQLWRFDIQQEGLITGGVIADIAKNDLSSNRRLFNEPDVALITTKSGGSRLAISFGSGTRFNPLDRFIEDRFYAIFQDRVYRAPDSYTKVTEDHLEDRTGYSNEAVVESNGWYVKLENAGEKVLAGSTTVNNQVIFTTYEPKLSEDDCQVLEGQSRIYFMNLLNAAPVQDLNGDGEINPKDVSKQLNSPAIPPAPRILFPEGSKPVVLVGPEQPLQNLDLGEAEDWTESYWYEQE